MARRKRIYTESKLEQPKQSEQRKELRPEINTVNSKEASANYLHYSYLWLLFIIIIIIFLFSGFGCKY